MLAGHKTIAQGKPPVLMWATGQMLTEKGKRSYIIF
jgi:hypothetical protein